VTANQQYYDQKNIPLGQGQLVWVNGLEFFIIGITHTVPGVLGQIILQPVTAKI
jgi:hypothetical protein